MAGIKDKVKPKGDIPKHIMDGVLGGFEEKKEKLKRESLMDVTIDNVTPKMRNPAVDKKPEKKFEFKVKPKEDKIGGVLKENTTEIKAEEKAENKDPAPKVVPYGGDHPDNPKSNITEKKLDTIKKILEMQDNNDGVSAAVISNEEKTKEATKESTETPKAELHPDVQIVEDKPKQEDKKPEEKPEEKPKEGGALAKLGESMEKIKVAMPYIGLVVLVLVVISAIAQFNYITGNAVKEISETEELEIDEELHETDTESLDIEKIDGKVSDVSGKITGFFKEKVFGGIDFSDDSESSETKEANIEESNTTEQYDTEDIVGFIKSKLFSGLSDALSEELAEEPHAEPGNESSNSSNE